MSARVHTTEKHVETWSEEIPGMQKVRGDKLSQISASRTVQSTNQQMLAMKLSASRGYRLVFNLYFSFRLRISRSMLITQDDVQT